MSETHYFERDHSILGVTFVGPLIISNQSRFLECAEQIYQSTSQCIILNFRDVPADVDPEFLPMIQNLLMKIREKSALLRISGVHPDLRKTLQDLGYIQVDELVNNLADALSSLPPINPSAKKSPQ